MSIPSFRRAPGAFFVGMMLVLLAQPAVLNADDKGDNTLEAFGITPTFGKWPLGFIPFVYNSTGAPAGFTNEIMEAVFADAIGEWARYCNLTFIYGGVNDGIDIDTINDGIVVFGWEDIGGAAGQAGPANAGVSALWGYANYLDGTFKLNPNVYNDIGTTPGEIINNALSIRETAAHEIGHLIGLGHSDQPDTIMYSNPYNSISHTMEDDISDCRKMYGHSTVYDPPGSYVPPSAGNNTYNQLFISSSVDFPGEADAVDDGMTYADSDVVYTAYYQPTPGYSDDLVTVVVDPLGRASVGSSELAEEDAAFIYADGIMSFRQLREIPGLWTFYVYDDTGLLLTRTIDVTTSLPAVNEAPVSTFSYSEDVSTRSISVTTDIMSDPDGDQVSLAWHIPTIGQVSVALQNAPLSDSQNVSLNPDGLDWEIFADVRDDHSRYTEDPGNNVGPAGPGWHDLHRYYASPWDFGPDHNGDNYSDIPLRNSNTGQNWLYVMGGNLVTASEYVGKVSAPGWQEVGHGDFDKNGRHDKLWWNSITGQLWIHLMDGSSIATSAPVARYDTDWRVAGTGDYDNDGNADILMRNATTGQLRILFMDGTTLLVNSFVTNLSALWIVVGNGDYNGDGTSDILIRHLGTGQNWLFLMNGDEILPASGPVNTVSNSNSMVVGSGDYNSDGFADILWYNTVTGRIWMYLMNGTTISAFADINVIPTSWIVAGNGDYNGDSFSDILLYNTVTGQIWIYFMNSFTIVASAPVGTISNLNWSIVNNP